MVLPFVPEDGEPEVRAMFAAGQPVRALSDDARDVADRLSSRPWSASIGPVRGASYTGLQPAGMDVGPVIPLAERPS